MATTVLTTYPAVGSSLSTWTALANGQAGDNISAFQFSDKTVQVGGTFGVGGSVTIQGSNDGTTWNTLTDLQGNALTMTASAIEAISENPRYIRPNVTAGDGTTALNVTILGRHV